MNYLKKLPKTSAYLDTITDENRHGHHIFVIEQKLNNTSIPLDSMSEFDVNALDSAICDWLKKLDVPAPV